MHVVDWLKTLDHIEPAGPIGVKIGHSTYHGGAYFEKAREGSHREPIMYLLGNLPASYKRSTHVCYRFPNETHDWYVAGFADAAVASAMPQFHPFGPWFQLRQWPSGISPFDGQEYETIDHFNERAFTRVKIRLVY